MELSISDATKIATFTSIFNHISDFSQYIGLVFDASGLSIKQDTSAECTIITNITWDSTWFASYSMTGSNPISITICACSVSKCMGLFQTTQTIRWSYSETNPTYMDFTLSDGYVTTLDVIYTIPVMDFPVDVTLVPTLTTYAATVTLHSGMLSILANNMVNFSETIVGKVYTNSVELCSSSEGSMRVVLPASRTASFTNVSGETVSVDINSTACIRICQFVSIASLVNLVVTSDNTMLVTYVTETGLSVQLFISSVAYTG